MSGMRFRSWASTHNGAVRTHNEDRFVDLPDCGLWAVADGAGGHDAGEVASGMIAETLSSIPPDLGAAALLSEIRSRIERTNAALCEAAAQRGPSSVIASTLVVLVARGGHFACLWAGDSRAYLLRDGALQQISRDHSLVQELVDAGAIRAEDAENHPRANVITRAVGGSGDEALELDKVSGPILAGDRFLLCSDGLCKTLHDDELAALLAGDAGQSPSEAMIEAALARKVNDNVTAVVIEASDG
jgi:protein phosphatase/serine/threonine-protein phosphatase Stp1